MATTRVLRWVCGVWLACAFGLVIAACREPSPTSLAGLVQKAKREGRDSIGFIETPEIIQGGTLETHARYFSMIVATPSRLAAVVSTTTSHIYTWNVFKEVSVLAHADPALRKPCRLALPKGMAVAPGELAMPVPSGTAVVDGIKITMGKIGWTPRDLSAHYVFLANECSNRMVLPVLADEVFEVTRSGLRAVAGARFPFQREIASLETLDGLKTFFASTKRPMPLVPEGSASER